jgi:PAS domain S-box-containing protein
MEQPMLFQDKDMGKLVIDVDFDELLKDLRARNRRLFAIACVIIVLSIGAIWVAIEGMVSRPITHLAQASKRLAEGDFAAPLPPTGRDEVGELVQSFDQMRTSISNYQAELISRNESLIKLSHAIEQSPVSIVITDRNGLVEFVNPRFTEVLGYDLREMLGKNIRLLKTEDPAGPSFETIWQTVSAGRIWRGEFRSARKNGEVFQQSVSLSPIKNDRGEITNTVALMEDISEQRALEEQLRQSQKMEAVGLLTGGIAHDFNNILYAITGYGSLVLMKMAQDNPLRHHVDEILSAANRAAKLTQSLLAFSRKQVVKPQPVNVNELINRMEKMLLRLIREDIEFRTILHPAPLTVFIDPGQLEQALINLVTNARDAMPSGGSLIIETGPTSLSEQFAKKHGEVAEGPYVLISVSDTGIGMEEGVRERIFEPFFTTKEQGKGTGLGLSTVYGIVKQHNGYINCYSMPARGTTFKLYFPLVAAPDMELPKVILPEITKGKETVLLAEDDETVREYTISILQEAGYTVMAAANGQEALMKFHEQPGAVDLLLLDVIMPKKNGREVYEEARKVRPGMKVLFTSGYTAELVAEKGIIRGDINFLTKPCSPTDLLRKIREVLEQPVSEEPSRSPSA